MFTYNSPEEEGKLKCILQAHQRQLFFFSLNTIFSIDQAKFKYVLQATHWYSRHELRLNNNISTFISSCQLVQVDQKNAPSY